MRVVKGIYDDDGQLMLISTLTQDNHMMGVLAYVGITTGLRISDLLELNVRQIVDDNGLFIVRESKTGKEVEIEMDAQGFELVKTYIDLCQLQLDDKLFPTTRQTVHNYFKRACAFLNLHDISVHSMRKTYA